MTHLEHGSYDTASHSQCRGSNEARIRPADNLLTIVGRLDYHMRVELQDLLGRQR
jgi:hypothetical protein